MLNEAVGFGLQFEPHFVDALNPNAGDRQHNERKGIYRARKKIVRDITGPLHRSVKERWDLDTQNYRQKGRALRKLLHSVGGDWNQIELAG